MWSCGRVRWQMGRGKEREGGAGEEQTCGETSPALPAVVVECLEADGHGDLPGLGAGPVGDVGGTVVCAAPQAGPGACEEGADGEEEYQFGRWHCEWFVWEKDREENEIWARGFAGYDILLWRKSRGMGCGEFV